MTTDLHYSAPIPTSEPITIILTVILLLLFFIGLFSVFFFKCFLENILNSWNLTRTPSGHFINLSDDKVPCGLDPKHVQAFPTFPYLTLNGSEREKYGLECTICLTEFEENSTIRMLTLCRHIFHQDCIDLWFESHKTCPICRVDLAMPQNSLNITLTSDHNDAVTNNMEENNGLVEDSISIDIREDVHDEIISTHATSNLLEHDEALEVERLSRSDSTGHLSWKNGGEGADMYTLRLNEHVKVNSLIHNRARSCITFGEMPSQSCFIYGGIGSVSLRPSRYTNR